MKFVRRIVLLLVVLIAAGFGIYRLQSVWGGARQSEKDVATYRVQRRTLEDRVVNRGTVES